VENEIEPFLHLETLDGDDDGCLVASTMIEEDHKPFSFLLQQQTSQMIKIKRPNHLYPRGLGASHECFGQLMIFSKTSAIFSISRDFFESEKVTIFRGRFFAEGKKSRFFDDFFNYDLICIKEPCFSLHQRFMGLS
jgi:hypothetical protein